MTLLKAGINRIMDSDIFQHDPDLKNEFICSTFVAEMLSMANIRLFKNGFIPAPSDFKSHRKLRYEFRGNLQNHWKRVG